MTTNGSTTTIEELEDFASKFWADQEEKAAAVGKNVYQYIIDISNGEMKPVLVKMLRHQLAHPNECPEDCAWQAVIRNLKKHYGITSF